MTERSDSRAMAARLLAAVIVEAILIVALAISHLPQRETVVAILIVAGAGTVVELWIAIGGRKKAGGD